MFTSTGNQKHAQKIRVRYAELRHVDRQTDRHTHTSVPTYISTHVAQAQALYLTFIVPCIVVYSYSTTNKIDPFLKLFILVKRSTCFARSLPPSTGAQDCTHSNRHMSNSCCYLLLTGTRWNYAATCCCVCSLKLLMMDRKPVRNM